MIQPQTRGRDSAHAIAAFAWLVLAGQPAVATARDAAPLLEEVTVYAQKRSEPAQSVPVAITALDGEKIRETGMSTVEELSELHPSVSFDTAQSWQNSSLKIRGIGTFGNTRSFEGAVGVFIDEVYRPRPAMALSELLDITRLEVMRGPQSTLFGKNTVAGAISLHSEGPVLNEWLGFAESRLGNFDRIYLAGAVNVPLADAVAARVAGVTNQRDGFFRSPDTGEEYDAVDRHAVKFQLLNEYWDGWTVRLIADSARSDAPCCWGSAQVVNGPVAPLVEAYSGLNGFRFVRAPEAERNRLATLNAVPREPIRDEGIAAHVSWDGTERWSARSITAFRNWEHSQLNADPDFVPADLFILNEPADIDTFSQEFNVRYSGQDLDLLLGLYYSREDYFSLRSAETGSDADNYLNALISAGQGAVGCLPPVVAVDCLFPAGVGALLPDGEFTREIYRQDTIGRSLFAHGTWSFRPNLDLVAGLRYDAIRKDGGVTNLFWYDSAIARAALAAAGVPDDGTARNGLDLIGTFNSPSFTAATRDKELTGTLQAIYSISDIGIAYGGYHRGFKAGGVNLFREGAITSTRYAPEIADSFEAGVKLDYLNGRARTNATLFHTRFTDLQINFFTGLEFRTENTGEASTWGLEVENYLQISDRLRAELALTYLNSTFDRITNPLLGYLVNRDTPRAPRWSGVASVEYRRDLPAALEFFARGTASYMGSHYVGADVAGEPRTGDFMVTDLSAGVSGDEGRWSASLWCRNCTDESYRTIYFNSTFQPGSYNVFLNDPRTYGVTFSYHFAAR